MKLNENSTVFDLLALICSFFDKEQERQYAMKKFSATSEQIDQVLIKYKNLFAIILNASNSEYIINNHDLGIVNRCLERVQEDIEKDTCLLELYILAIQIEGRIETYAEWSPDKFVCNMQPLNLNYEEMGIMIYPYIAPMWDQTKAEQNRQWNLNALFTNYFIIRKSDLSPFELKVHYLDMENMMKIMNKDWQLNIELSPVTNSIELVTEEDGQTHGVKIEKIRNDKELNDRIFGIFDEIFEKDYGIIVFPEVLGSKKIVEGVKNRMRMHPQKHVLVILPTYCENNHNTLVVLGPGGIEVLKHTKNTPFLLRKDGRSYKEALDYNGEMHLLITKGFGNVAFPICAEFLEPQYYSCMTEVAKADTVLCASFSPGEKAFEKTLLKGLSRMMLGLWVNTCSARVVSNNNHVSDVLSVIQLPDAMPGIDDLYRVQRKCDGSCSATSCYFDIALKYKDGKFSVIDTHCFA